MVMWADRASYWIFVLLLGYISLVPFYYLQPLSLEEISFHFFKYLPFLLCVALIAARLIVVRRWAEMMDKTDCSMGGYLLFCCLSLVGADYLAIGALKLFYYSVTGVGLFYIARSFDADSLYKILRWVAWFSMGVAIYGVVSYLGGADFPYFGGADFLWGRWYDVTHYHCWNRLSSTLGNPLFLGGFICLTVPILVNEAFWTSAGLRRVLLLIGVVTAAISLILTVARSAWIAVVFMTALWLGLSRHRRRAAKKGIQIGIGIAVFVLLMVPVANFSFFLKTTQTVEYIGNRIGYTSLDENNIRGRLNLFKIAAAEIASQPLMGMGFGNFTRVFVERHQRASIAMGIPESQNTTENMYLMLAVETGLISLWAMLFFWYKRLGDFRRVFSVTQNRQQRLALLAVFIGVCGFLLQILAWDGLNQPTTRILFWSLLGTACSIAQDHLRTKK